VKEDGSVRKRLPDGQIKDLAVKLEGPVYAQGARVDGKEEKLVAMTRDPRTPWGVIWYWDLKTGKVHRIAGPAKGETPDPAFHLTSGPGDKVSFWCAAGSSFGPDKGERYVYMGGGDENNFSIIDIQKKYVYKMIPADPKDKSLWTFGESKGVKIRAPVCPIWGRDGEFYLSWSGKEIEVYRPVEGKK
jgi:hypothetical protein